MANAICIVGESGSGKSSSLAPIPELGLKGLNPKETFIINIKGKPLPIKGWKKQYKEIDITKPPIEGNYLATTNTELIVKTINYINSNRSDIKNVVIDDFQYQMSEEYMSKALQTGFTKFNVMAKNAYDIINVGLNMSADKNFIVLTHSEEDNGKTKIKTIGKMLDSAVNLAGLFTIVLYTQVLIDKGVSKYYFVTNASSDGETKITAKSPFGMFDELLVPNDLGEVLEKVEKYYSGE